MLFKLFQREKKHFKKQHKLFWIKIYKNEINSPGLIKYIYPKLLPSTPWSEKTLTRFFSGFEIITRVTIPSIKYLASISVYNTISAIVLDPEKNRVKVFLDHT